MEFNFQGRKISLNFGEIIPAIVLLVLVLAIVGYGSYLYSQNFDLKLELATTQAEVNNLTNRLASSTAANNNLLTQLSGERSQAEAANDRANQIFTAVSVLKKLNETDKELLQKYSKVYFLNEHYTPNSLSQIDNNFIFEKGRSILIHAEVTPFLNDLMNQARNEGVDLSVLSAYRSYGVQSSLKKTYQVTYGSGSANKFSADQGYSEHQLGTTLDFTNEKVGGVLTGFEKTEAYDWLMANAYKYGFVLSYPKNNTYYVFEPWHWRFVGVKLATYLHSEGKNFYDVDQRVIDQYLINIFDR